MNKTGEYNETKTDLFEEDVLAKKDLDKAIADRAQWRADERRWCREGKLPQVRLVAGSRG